MTVVLIHGTSSGIGLATALRLATGGRRVYATMRDLGRAGALQSAAAERGVAIELLQLDVDDDDSVRRAGADVLAREGRIDALVNNAGTGPLGAVELSDDARAKRVFETNFFGALRTIRAVLPAMRAQRGGRIVNVSSVAGRVAAPCMGIYAASKSALEAVSESLASEARPHGIRVVLIEPGFIVTPILQEALNGLSGDPASPYAATERRMGMIFAQAQQTGGAPERVAAVIAAALDAPEPRLRYLVGEDAESLVAGRARMGDESWIAMGRHERDEDFFAEFAERFPVPAALPDDIDGK